MTQSDQPPHRVIVFIDEANVYEDAKRAFGANDPKIPGRIKPMGYGMLLADRMPLGESAPRELKEVRVYTGVPSSSKDSKSYGAHRKQTAGWAKAGATVISRPLRYPREWPKARPEQKGVDVQIAIASSSWRSAASTTSRFWRARTPIFGLRSRRARPSPKAARRSRSLRGEARATPVV